MQLKLTPDHFRDDLTNQMIDDIALDERRTNLHDRMKQLCCWGMQLRALGIDVAVMDDLDFDPVDFGIERRARPCPRIV